MRDIREELGKRILLFDGGMGSLLQERGLPAGELPENWNTSQPEAVEQIHREYIEAGADIILANTFGANSLKFGDRLEEIVRSAVRNARNAARQAAEDVSFRADHCSAKVAESGREVYVALDLGPTGKLLKPLGPMDFEEAVEVFGRTVEAGARAGADFILIETMSDIYELKAAVLACKEHSSLPVMATVTFDEKEKMLTGASPEAVSALLEGLGVDAFGMNCGLGPKQMRSAFARLKKVSSLPLIVNPNAGLPRTENGLTVYDVGPEEFASEMRIFAEEGAWLVGGCCGTTPAHIRALKEAVAGLHPVPVTEKDLTVVSSGTHAVELGGRPAIIGERINPTGKSKFKQALRDHNIPYILEEGIRQSDKGADILDVNVGLPEIDEAAMMGEVVCELQSVLDLPLQIDTTDIAAMERALRLYNGKAMINSVNGKKEVMDQVFPLAAKYGGVVVGLCLDENGIPASAEGRLAVADKIIKTASQYGIRSKDIVIDALTMTMSTDDSAAKVTLETVRRLTLRGIRTVLGVSNISFGLPARELINASFFAAAMQAGLSAGIINPGSAQMRQAYDLQLLLGGFDSQCAGYIEKYADTEPVKPAVKKASKQGTEKHVTAGNEGMAAEKLKNAVVRGLKEQAFQETKALLKTLPAMEIINTQLVPALNEVGKGFESGRMFLPQLLMSAEAAKAGFEAIREELEKTGNTGEKKGTIVIATVKGDIHDIGKNIVKVLLENYGYEVIDLGKDVPAEAICRTVEETKAPLLGLSALMTTTVGAMEETIRLVKEKAPWCRVMVGGAVLTQEYADKIGADFYGKDAMQSVRYAEDVVFRSAT